MLWNDKICSKSFITIHACDKKIGSAWMFWGNHRGKSNDGVGRGNWMGRWEVLGWVRDGRGGCVRTGARMAERLEGEVNVGKGW